MSESNDTLTALLIFAWFMHTLTLLGMVLRTPPAGGGTTHDAREQGQPLRALFLGRAPVQRTGRNTLYSRMLAASGLLLAAAFAMSLTDPAAPAWTTALAALAVTQLGSAYAWHKPARAVTDGPTERDHPDDERGVEADDEASKDRSSN
ncbi:hypothetical protein [Streptomyces sp. NPDC056304]|uniref:hypothetical protein n=1 Tax=Streptomyces sp. NPDC056304 TaxID=3345778 RepID=UPI0035D714EB